MDKKLEAILKRVQRPSTYVGGEVGVSPINPEMRVRFCLCYPDLYSKGMSGFEVRVLYHLLNDRKGYSCERCFAPYLDMAEELKKANMPLFSLETRTSLADFDILGFAFNDELNYTNFLYMLSLAEIPLEAKERTTLFPLIYGFSKCMVNPETLAGFLDFAIIGDYEDVTIKVIDCVNKCKLSKLSKSDMLKQLSQIAGVYVPSTKKVAFDANGKLNKISGEKVSRQIIRDLDRTYFPNKFMVPNDEVEGDVAFIELMRGCEKGCRFCQEGYINRPLREKRVQNLVSQATSQIIGSGYDEINLYSLNSASYTKINNLASFIDPLCVDKNAKWSVSNHRSEHFEQGYKALKKEKVLSISVEAASEKLRRALNKDLSDDEIESSVKYAFSNGTSSVKLYLMIGLPFETADDLMKIVELADRIKSLYKDYRKSTKSLSLTIETSTFIPKPFTPFQWCGFIGVEEAEKRQKFLEYAFEKMGVNYICDDAKQSEISAILARGDRNLTKMLMVAFKRGAIFCKDSFDTKPFDEAFSVSGIQKDNYLAKKEIKSILAYDLVDIGITKKFFESEYKKAQAGEVTPSCSHNCAKCGLEGTGVCKYGRC